VTSPLVLLLQPHAMQYDAAFLVPSLAVLADLGGRRAILPLGLVYFAALAMPFADRISVSPAFGVVLATFVLVHRELVTLPAEIAPTPRSAR
jgi:hypothetical protein